MNTGSYSEYARHIGASPAYVTKLKRQGRIVTVERDGKTVVNFDASDRMVRNTADMGRAANGKNAGGGGTKFAEIAASAPVADDFGGGRFDVLYRKAQTQEKIFNAKLAQLEFEKASGKLIERDRASAGAFSAFRQLRDALGVLPRKVAPAAAVATDVREVEALIARAIREALDLFANRTLPELLAAVGADAADAEEGAAP